MGAVLVWLLTVEMIGLATLPLAARLGRKLPDRGYQFARPLGILALGYLAWAMGMLGAARYTRATLVLFLACLGIACWALWRREVVTGLSGRRAILLWNEAVFLVVFLIATFIRSYNSAIDGQERPMDFAFMNGFLKAEDLPAEDPWLSGYGMPYYHLGYLLMATLAKVSGVPGPVAYNLSVALVFAMLAGGSFSLVYNLAYRLQGSIPPNGESPGDGPELGRPPFPESTAPKGIQIGPGLAGALAALLVAVMGNLEAALELVAAVGWGDASFWSWVGVRGLSSGSGAFVWPPADPNWWWRASRVVPNIRPDGINEFPYFSFLLGDMHPHFMALPWDLLIIALALERLLAAGDPGSTGIRGDGTRFVVTGLALGFLLAGNTWDVATYWLLYGLAVVVAHRIEEQRWAGAAGTAVEGSGSSGHAPPVQAEAALTAGRRPWASPWSEMGAQFGTAVGLYLPYFVAYTSQPLYPGVVTERTPLPSLLILFGPLLAFQVMLAARDWANPQIRASAVAALGGLGRIVALAIGFVLLLEAALGELTILLLSALLVVSVGQLVAAVRLWQQDRHGAQAAAVFSRLLSALAMAILLGVEVLYINDSFQSRMNTVFKFHYHAWVLLGLSSAIGIYGVLKGTPGKASYVPQLIAAGLTVLMLGLGGIYPVFATISKSGWFAGESTLDGTRFLEKHRPSDYRAVQWLAQNVAGRPVVLEAVGADYSEYGRISTFSGLPTLLGWPGHEVQWRGGLAELSRRQVDVEALYSRADTKSMLDLLSSYRVRYVVVGGLEEAKYGGQVRQRFEGVLEQVFQEGDVAIYRVPLADRAVSLSLSGRPR